MPCRRGAMPGAYSKRSKGRKKRVARKEEVPLDPLTAEFQKISDDFRNNNKVKVEPSLNKEELNVLFKGAGVRDDNEEALEEENHIKEPAETVKNQEIEKSEELMVPCSYEEKEAEVKNFEEELGNKNIVETKKEVTSDVKEVQEETVVDGGKVDNYSGMKPAASGDKIFEVASTESSGEDMDPESAEESTDNTVKQVNEGLRFMVKELVASDLEAIKEESSPEVVEEVPPMSLEVAKEAPPAAAALRASAQQGGGVGEQEDQLRGAEGSEEKVSPVAVAGAAAGEAGRHGERLRAASAPQLLPCETGVEPVGLVKPPVDLVKSVGLVKPMELVKPLALVKHPLEQRWTFWHLNPDKSLSWSEKQRAVMTVATVEDFWATYNWILPPSGLRPGTDYSFFLAGVQPDWEDAANLGGGRWVAARSRDGLDRGWRELLMALVGAKLGPAAAAVTGAVVNVRPKGDKLAVWVGRGGGGREVGADVERVLGAGGRWGGGSAEYKKHR